MEDEPELVVANIHGYRSWRVETGENGPVLMSLFAGQKSPWLPGETKVAFCDTDYTHPGVYYFGMVGKVNEPGKHEAPGVNCVCGMWAYNEPDDPTANYLEADYGIVKIAGVVRASGVVEVHENGFRAKRLDIVAVSPTRVSAPGPNIWRCDCPACQDDARRAAAVADEIAAMKLVSERYRVPSFASFADLAEAFPPTQKNEPKPVAQQPGTLWLTGGSMSYSSIGYISLSQWRAASGLSAVSPVALTNPAPVPAPKPTLQQQVAYNGTAKYDPDDDTKTKLELSATVPVTSRKSIAELFNVDPATLGVNEQEQEQETPSWPTSASPFDASKLFPSPRPQKRPSRSPLRNPFRSLFRRSR